MLKFNSAFLGILFPIILLSQPFTPAKTRLEGLNLNAESRFSTINTESIGPTVMSGRVTDIEVNPNNPIEMVVAYASGGVWYTNNNGQSFRPIFDNQHSITIGDIAVDWKKFTIWVGTGESNSSRSSYAGTGVYKTGDTGHTWKHLGLEETHHIGKVLLHPTNNLIAYVAAMGHLYSLNDERGVYKTTDGGATWQKVLFIDNKTGCIDLCFDPLNNETLIAATWERQRSPWNFSGAGAGSGIYMSKNAGGYWTKVYSANKTGRIGLATFSKNGSSGLYAIVDDQNSLPPEAKDTSILTIEDLIKMETQSIDIFLAIPDSKLKIFLNQNGFPEKLDSKAIKKLIKTKKNTVKDIINYTGNANRNLFNVHYKGSVIIKTNSLSDVKWETVNDSIKDLYYTYGYYFGQIRVNPSNPDDIYILGVVLARSLDGGKIFKKLSDDNVHADHHVIWINPSNSSHIINGNDGGMNISYDNGQNWVKCNSPAVGQFYAIAVDEAEPYNVYGGLQDNGVWKGPRYYSSGTGWHQSGKYPYQFIMGGDGMQVAVDTKQNLVYTGYQFGNYYRLDIEKDKSTYITPKHELGEFPYRFNWQSPILLSRHAQNTLYFGGNYLFRSFDKGQTWKKISPDLTSGGKEGNVPYGTLTTIDESSLKFGLIYTGSDDGNVYVTKDGGNNWNNISLPVHRGYWVSRVQASGQSESRVYAVLNGYRQDIFTAFVFVSEDYGKTWKPIHSNLPSEPVNVIREDLVNPEILYVGTDNGLYISYSKGKSWEKLGDLPRVAVHDLAIQPKANELLVGTHGRSLYVIGLSEINSLDSGKLSQSLFVYYIPKQKASKSWGNSYYYWSPPFQSNISISYYSAKVQEIELTISDSLGVVIYYEKLKASKGVNYFKYNYTSSQNQNLSKFLRKGKDGKYHVLKGSYKLKLISGEMMEVKDFILEEERE
ncbi:MAG: VPS10 domain-containing protein [Bacteroidia bacterium]